MQFKTHPAAMTALVLSGAVVIHAGAAEQFCIVHPLSMSCDNSLAPGPEYPHEQRMPTPGPTGSIAAITVLSTATVTGSTGTIMRSGLAPGAIAGPRQRLARGHFPLRREPAVACYLPFLGPRPCLITRPAEGWPLRNSFDASLSSLLVGTGTFSRGRLAILNSSLV